MTLARLPLKKFAKQFFPVGVAHRHTGLMAYEGVEVGSLLLFLLLLGLYLLQHVFGHAKPGPAGYRGRQIYVAPFRMIGRVLQRVPAREQILDETADLRIAVGVFRPIEHRKHCRNRYRVDAILTLQQVGVVLLGEFAEGEVESPANNFRHLHCQLALTAAFGAKAIFSNCQPPGDRGRHPHKPKKPSAGMQPSAGQGHVSPSSRVPGDVRRRRSERRSISLRRGAAMTIALDHCCGSGRHTNQERGLDLYETPAAGSLPRTMRMMSSRKISPQRRGPAGTRGQRSAAGGGRRQESAMTSKFTDPARPAFHLSVVRLACSACGAEANASCNCGKPYSPRERAAEVVAAHPEKSNRAIADEIGASEATVRRARDATASGDAVAEPRIGRDGKARRLPSYNPDATALPPDPMQDEDLIDQIVNLFAQLTRNGQVRCALELRKLAGAA